MNCFKLIIFISFPFNVVLSQVQLPKELKKNYSFIPSGKSEIENDTLSFNSFYISKTEISNKEYKEFLTYLKRNRDTIKLRYCKIDSTNWEDVVFYGMPYLDLYSSHPAYENYPVVNISYEAALEFCNWLTEKYKNSNIKFSLPTRKEWIYAASGLKNEVYSPPYSFGNSLFKAHKGKIVPSCNFLKIGDERIKYNLDSNFYEIVKIKEWQTYVVEHNLKISHFTDLIAPIKSYWPSNLGLYNMNGNISEMVLEKGIAVGGSWCSGGYDIRNESFINYTEPKPTVGFRPMLKVSEK